ncbi:MAG: aminotransferase class III-fold pyridoxal phosphate-dependent enzyme [Proteobacteria bacterium]|nr:aminotransferase class III-fold pyridoxal phosphate-dependent enzyme [Pseudomonadota bacterium]
MRPLAVYAKLGLALSRAAGCYIYDTHDRAILDFYSGHGVISIGHSHPHFINRLEHQLRRLLYYSNAVDFAEQEAYCEQLGALSACTDYDLFLANSGAEAIENALKIASLQKGRTKIVAMLNGFHGRTSLAAQCTEAAKICAPINSGLEIVFIALDDTAAAAEVIDERTAAVLIEGIQGVGGVEEASSGFWQTLQELSRKHGALLIADEIQSGFGRSGLFFSFQHHGISPDLICTAKGMGNGYPIAGTWVKHGLSLAEGSLGTTFGGNPLACAAGLAVCEVIAKDELIARADQLGKYLKNELASIPQLSHLRGRGLMIGFDFEQDSSVLRSKLLHDHGVITGSARHKKTVRLLPPLTIEQKHCDEFLDKLQSALRTL